ncbi:MAG: calcium-binding protein [Asticcacaulis sp.]|nr:calcium-binding protein [Asticcacaulis sp.]
MASIISGSTITFEAGSDYVYTLSDATAGPGQTKLYVYADQLGAGDNLTFDGSAETTASIYLTAGAGVDTLTGGQANDHFVIHDHLTTADSINGGAGFDWLYLIGDYSAGLTFGASTIKNMESLYFGAGYSYKIILNDANIAAGQQLQIYGKDLTLTDSLNVNGTAETNGSFYFDSATSKNTLIGGAQSDTFYIHNGVGHGGVGTLNGNAGNDLFVFDGDITASNRINGGSGTDSVDLSGFNAGLALVMTATTMTGIETLSLSGGSASITTHDATIAAGARLTVSSDAALTLNGSAEKDGYFTVNGGEYGDNIKTGALNDTISTYGGNDTLNGGAGADMMTGGLGNDTYYVDNTGDKVVELNGQGTDTVISSVTFGLSGQYIENLTLTGSSNLNATGNALANVLTGNSGNNVLNGGTGADTMIGGAGNDIYYVDSFYDVVTELNGGGTDTVYSSVQYIMGGSYVENATLTGTLNSYAVGNALDNILIGNSGNNNLTGGAGNDRLNGGTGADGLRGGVGNDIYYVDNLGDFIVENKDEGTDLVYSTVSFNLGAQYIEYLTLTGTGNINGLGNALANTITGNAGNNLIDGRQGNDKLTGGAGADIFQFTAGSGKDAITDFSASQNDSLNLHDYSQATAVITQVGNDTVIDLGGGNVITLTGALKADVTSHITW